LLYLARAILILRPTTRCTIETYRIFNVAAKIACGCGVIAEDPERIVEQRDAGTW
jgi:hypothetical protein